MRPGLDRPVIVVALFATGAAIEPAPRRYGPRLADLIRETGADVGSLTCPIWT